VKRILQLFVPMVLGAAVLAAVACSKSEPVSPTATPGADRPTSSSDTPTPVAEPTLPEIEMVRALAPIDNVTINVAESFPVQYFLHVTSGLPSGCAKFDDYEVARDEDTVQVTVWNLEPAPNQQAACTMIYGIVETNIALGSDFDPGKTYAVSVNGMKLELKTEGTAGPGPSEVGEMARVPAPIEDLSIAMTKSLPPQYLLHITSGLPGGCVKFDNYEVVREGDAVRVSVWNLEPVAPVPCTLEYGYQETSINLGSDFEAGKSYTVFVNDKQIELKGQGAAKDLPTLEVEVGAQVALEQGQSVQFSADGPKVQFLEVIEDSRCPKNTVCIRAGSATVLVGISGAGQFPRLAELKLVPEAQDASSALFGDYTVRLIALDPYPEAGEPGEEPASAGFKVVMVQVTKP